MLCRLRSRSAKRAPRPTPPDRRMKRVRGPDGRIWLSATAAAEEPSRPITVRTVQRACREAVEAAGLDKSVTVHTLRHCFATHLLEQGVDIRVIQGLLGHRHITSTTRYARVALSTISQVQSPLELLNLGTPAPA
jgi:integrase